MNRSRLTFSAALIAAALTLGIIQTAPASAAAMPNLQTPIAQTVKVDGLELVRGHGGHSGNHGFRRFDGPRAHTHGPRHRYGARRFYKPGNWCKNHPRRCFGTYRPWRWCKNHPRRCAGYGGWGYAGGGEGEGSRCHRHLYPVPGMAFHPRIRCNHRHYRAYDSWEWAN